MPPLHLSFKFTIVFPGTHFVYIYRRSFADWAYYLDVISFMLTETSKCICLTRRNNIHLTVVHPQAKMLIKRARQPYCSPYCVSIVFSVVLVEHMVSSEMVACETRIVK